MRTTELIFTNVGSPMLVLFEFLQDSISLLCWSCLNFFKTPFHSWKFCWDQWWLVGFPLMGLMLVGGIPFMVGGIPTVSGPGKMRSSTVIED